MVLHTGGAGAGSMWGDDLEPLARFRLLLVDHRGRGGSDRPTTLSAHRIEQYVADARALADVAGLDRYAFVPYSFGGGVGLRLAARDRRVRGLVALGTGYEPPGADASDSVYDEPVQTGMAAFVEMVEREDGIVLPEALRSEFLDTDAEQFRLTLAACPDPWKELASIAAPVLLIAGAEEDPDRAQNEMAARLPDGRSVYLAGCGHVGAFLRAGEVAAAALPRLERASRARTTS